MKKLFSILFAICILMVSSFGIIANAVDIENNNNYIVAENTEEPSASSRAVVYLADFAQGLWVTGTHNFTVSPAAGKVLRVKIRNPEAKTTIYLNGKAVKTVSASNEIQNFVLVSNCSGASYTVGFYSGGHYIYGYILQTDY